MLLLTASEYCTMGPVTHWWYEMTKTAATRMSDLTTVHNTSSQVMQHALQHFTISAQLHPDVLGLDVTMRPPLGMQPLHSLQHCTFTQPSTPWVMGESPKLMPVCESVHKRQGWKGTSYALQQGYVQLCFRAS